MPVCSIIIPVHNAERTIGEAIASVQAQTLEDWEIIAVDDGSTDRSAVIVAEAARSDPRVRLIRQPNRGPAEARNRGLDRAHGDFIGFLDADDVLLPHALRVLVATAVRSPDRAAFGSYDRIAPDGRDLRWPTVEPLDSLGLDEFRAFNRFPVHCQLIERKNLGDVRFRGELPALEDWDFWLRLAERGVRWFNCRSIVGRVRLSPCSRSTGYRNVVLAARDMMSRVRAIDVLQRFALEAATAAALGDPSPDCDDAASIYALAGELPPVTPELAARVARWTLPAAACDGPDCWNVLLDRFVAALAPLWRRLEQDGRTVHDEQCARSFEDAALTELAPLLVEPEAIVEWIMAELDPAQPVVLVGFGRNARRLAPGLAQKGIKVSARDDRIDPADPPRDASASGIRFDRMDDPLDPRAQVIVTPVDDAAIMARLDSASAARAIRWSRHRAALAHHWRARLLSAWPGPRDVANRSGGDPRLEPRNPISASARAPEVSVIVPLFNSAPTIAETIASIQAQTIDRWEAVIVDDASTDRGPSIAHRFGEADHRVRIVRHDRNRGLAAARNTGITHARAPFIHFLDADDWLLPDGLARLLCAARASRHGAAFGAHEWRDSRGLRLSASDHSLRPVNLDRLLEGSCFPAHAQLISREALKNERFDESLRCIEDYDLWLRLALRGLEWSPVQGSEPVCAYRLRPGSMSRGEESMMLTTIAVRDAAFKRARASGVPADGIDLSEERLARIHQQCAITYCTMRAAREDADDPVDEAADLYRSAIAAVPALASRRIDPACAAAAACGDLPYARCDVPSSWSIRAEEYLPPLIAWWSRCIAEGWAEPDLIDIALARLARLILDPRDVADAMAQSLSAGTSSAGPLIVYGWGRNGRLLADALSRRGMPFLIHDDGPIDLPASLSRASLADLNNPGSHILISPLDDHAILERLGNASRASRTRWSAVVAHLAQQHLARLRHVAHAATMNPGKAVGAQADN